MSFTRRAGETLTQRLMHQSIVRFWHVATVLAVVGAAILIDAPAATVSAADLRVMSFNVRVGSADQNTPNDWDLRRDHVVQTVENYNPDLLGLQEDLLYQGNYIRSGLAGYSKFGRGAEADGSGEQVSVLYKISRFTPVRQGSFWLSPTPSTAGSEFANAEFPRIVNWLELRDNFSSGLNFVIMNTHWEHGGSDLKDEVRLRSAALMRSKMTEIAPNLPMIFTGDFNADEGSDPYRRMTSRDGFVETPVDETRFLTDTYRNKNSDSATVGTALGFDGVGTSGRIDWILHDDTSFDTIEAHIDRTSFIDGAGVKRYPSDHFPINAIIRPTPVPEPATGLSLLGGATAAMMLRRGRGRR